MASGIRRRSLSELKAHFTIISTKLKRTMTAGIDFNLKRLLLFPLVMHQSISGMPISRVIAGYFPTLSFPGIRDILIPITQGHVDHLESLETIIFSIFGKRNQLAHNLAWISLDLRESKKRKEENKTFRCHYPRALVCPARRTFPSLFSDDINNSRVSRPGQKEEELGRNGHSWN